MIAKSQSFEIHLEWIDKEGDADSLSAAKISARLDGQPVWPAAGEDDVHVDIFADDLLAHLSEFWKPLMLRQTYPVKALPERPSALRRVAQERWAELPPAIVENEDSRVSDFEDAHDLSRAIAGQFGLLPLYLMRAGDRMIIDTGETLRSVPFDDTVAMLTALGDKISARLSKGSKWDATIASWANRDCGDPSQLLIWTTSLKPALALSLAASGTLEAPTSVAAAANDNNELRLAARMASALPDEAIRQVLALVGSFGKREAPELDQLAGAVSRYISDDFADQWAHVQGEAAAAFVRQQLNYASVQWIDIFGVIDRLGIELNTRAVEPNTLDGLSVWGPRHGPAILINAGSRRIQAGRNVLKSSAARVTAAHELCHQLLDRGHALSAVDILNSRMPLDIERRAKSFAGELLLPGRVAADVWLGMRVPASAENLARCLTKLANTYGVTRPVAAWKLDHGLQYHDIDLSYQLDQVAPGRR